MLIKSIRLHNIRSYTDDTIRFPAGSVLLSGDIGSGKSSVLLAVEFALFGMMRGALEGQSLLRNGKSKGYVELMIAINGRDVIIRRTLKKTRQGVQQDSGHIIMDGKKKEGTATELKAMVLDLLGYPKELLTKSKAMIYRYTVYTLQEEMKKILAEDKDARLETLRRVFGIDRYKRIRENSMVYLRDLKNRAALLEGLSSGLDEKENQSNEKKKEIEKHDAEIRKIRVVVEGAGRQVEAKRKQLSGIADIIKRLHELKREFDVNDAVLMDKVRQRVQNNRDISSEKLVLDRLKKDAGGRDFDMRGIADAVRAKSREIESLEKTVMEITANISRIDEGIRQSGQTKLSIRKLDVCPTCLQQVGKEHKSRITSTEDGRIEKGAGLLRTHKSEHRNALMRLQDRRKQVEGLKAKENAAEIMKVKLEGIAGREKRINELEEMNINIKKEIGGINRKKILLHEDIRKWGGIERQYSLMEKELERLMQDEKKAEIRLAGISEQLEGLAGAKQDIDREIMKKKEARETLKRVNRCRAWIDDYFIKLMGVMEKHVMTSIYSQFNELFVNWFNMLMEDETTNARLDDEFAPVVEQNGYEVSVGDLSGGERTACALAYRLALNRVINDVAGCLNTKDIIILDEPTEGFSREQLDRLREVLAQLRMKQVIIVSHESRIESFVENVIRIRKEEHVSRVCG